jgi:hypothetical protein
MLRATWWRGLDGDPDIQGTVIPGARLGMDRRRRVPAFGDGSSTPKRRPEQANRRVRTVAVPGPRHRDDRPGRRPVAFIQRAGRLRAYLQSGPQGFGNGMPHRPKASSQRDGLLVAHPRVQRRPSVPGSRRETGRRGRTTGYPNGPGGPPTALLQCRRPPLANTRPLGPPGPIQPRGRTPPGLLRPSPSQGRVTPPAPRLCPLRNGWRKGGAACRISKLKPRAPYRSLMGGDSASRPSQAHLGLVPRLPRRGSGNPRRRYSLPDSSTAHATPGRCRRRGRLEATGEGRHGAAIGGGQLKRGVCGEPVLVSIALSVAPQQQRDAHAQSADSYHQRCPEADPLQFL